MPIQRVLIFLIMILCTASLSLAQATISNREQGFRITLEPGWKQLELRKDFPNTFFRAAGPAGIEAAAVYVNVFKKGGYTPESYRQAVRRYVTTTMKGQIGSEEDVEIGGQEAWQVEYEGESVGYSGERRYFYNLVLFQDERIFVVHGTADESSWEAMRAAFPKIASTLRVS